MTEKFKVGDRVKVVNEGKGYSTYGRMADLMGLTMYEHGAFAGDGDVGSVVAIRVHMSDSPILAGIRCGDQEYIVGVEGLKLAPEPEKLSIKKMYNDFIALWSLGVQGEFKSHTEKEKVCKEKIGDYLNGCPACQYVKDHYYMRACDTYCPLDWGTFNGSSLDISPCLRYGSPYRTWKKAPTRTHALKVLSVPLRFKKDRAEVDMGNFKPCEKPEI